MSGLRLLNVGCGATFHPAWVNLDGFAVSKGVIACDVRGGLPFAEHSFDACYSSHALEHLTPPEGAKLLKEMHRVLKPDGIVRVAVPDLALVARDYLQALQRALDGAAGAEDDYDWMVIQLLDQSVRRSSGGEMSEFWRDSRRKNTEFVVARAGLEAERIISESRKAGGASGGSRRNFLARIRARTIGQLLAQLRTRAAKALVRLIAGEAAANAFQEGLFRSSGEIHQWMYDRYSLGRALENAGFVHPEARAADRSRIPHFNDYALDVVRGVVRKPDSLFMEAQKPAVGARSEQPRLALVAGDAPRRR
jgi:SAM-dependent methyltransferase